MTANTSQQSVIIMVKNITFQYSMDLYYKLDMTYWNSYEAICILCNSVLLRAPISSITKHIGCNKIAQQVKAEEG
jgi:hypothetical protein